MALIRMRNFFSVVAAISFLLPAISYATDYVVGDDDGWSTGVDYTEWAKGKTFRIGDTLTFLYSAGQHTVTKVDGKGFNSCLGSPNSGVLTSGNDKIILTTTGNKWYICGVSGHCDAGQKLKITVFPKSMILAPSPAPEMITLPSFPGAPEPVATPGYLPVEAGSHWGPTMAPPSEKVPAPTPAPACDAGQKLKITVFPKSMIPAPSLAPEMVTPPFLPGAPEPVATPGYLPVEAGSHWGPSMPPLPATVQVPAAAPAPTGC